MLDDLKKSPFWGWFCFFPYSSFLLLVGNSRIPQFYPPGNQLKLPAPLDDVDAGLGCRALSYRNSTYPTGNVGFTGCSCKENIIHSQEVNLETLKGKHMRRQLDLVNKTKLPTSLGPHSKKPSLSPCLFGWKVYHQGPFKRQGLFTDETFHHFVSFPIKREAMKPKLQGTTTAFYKSTAETPQLQTEIISKVQWSP